MDDVVIIEKISSMKQIAEEENKKYPFALGNKTKNAFFKTKYNNTIENKFNRTLSDSRQVVNLMDRMQGKVTDSPLKMDAERLGTAE